MTREEAIDVLKCNYPSSCFEELCKAVDIAIKALSAQERKKGRWEVTPWYIKCSECGESFMLMPQNYCPNCGAEMENSDE